MPATPFAKMRSLRKSSTFAERAIGKIATKSAWSNNTEISGESKRRTQLTDDFAANVALQNKKRRDEIAKHKTNKMTRENVLFNNNNGDDVT